MISRIGLVVHGGRPEAVAPALDAVSAGRGQTERRLLLTMRASRPLEIPDGVGTLLNSGRGPLLPAPRV